jgi:hypothetical protein
MNESKRTLAFFAVALVSVSAAAATYFGSQPKKDVDSARIGTEFYPEFKFPTEAQALRVVAYDKDTAAINEFKVEYKDGKWRIPSHHDYPADGKDRLARTAASVIGTSRAAFVSRSKDDWARYDVIDPEDRDDSVLTGRGQKITIAKTDGTVLAEYIIGKRKDSTGPGEGDVYYVRATKSDDPSTIYLADLKIDLSTKFGDWIEPDLLKVDRELLNDIKIDSYSIDEQQSAIIPGEVTELSRKNPSDPWTLKGIKPTEELRTDAVNTLVNNLDNLKLAGVRPKPPGILPDLSIEPRYAQEPRLVEALQLDMQQRGFFIGGDRKDKTRKVYGKEGELEAGTSEGLRYALKFGQIFTGTEFEIETGLSKDKDKNAKDKDADKTKAADAAAKAKASEDDEKDKNPFAKNGAGKDKDKDKEHLKRRYLMVYVTFDPKLCGEPPTRPLEPKKPQGLVLDQPASKTAPAAPKKPDAATNNSGTKADTAKPAGGGKSDEKHSSARALDDSTMLALALPDQPPAAPKTDVKPAPAASAPAAKGPAATKPAAKTGTATKPGTAVKPGDKAKAAPAKLDPKAEYDKALGQYKRDMEKYNNDKSEFEKKLKKGRDKAKQLNERFGPWYYVISAESFENLRQGRASLVQPKGTAPPPQKKGLGGPLEGLPMDGPPQ